MQRITMKRTFVLILSTVLIAVNSGFTEASWVNANGLLTELDSSESNVSESEVSSEEISEETSEKESEESSGEISEEASATESDGGCEDPSEEASETESDESCGDTPEEASETESEENSQVTSEEVFEKASEEICEDLSQETENDSEIQYDLQGFQNYVAKGNIVGGMWTLDVNGKLTVEGDSFSTTPWEEYAKVVKSASINAKPTNCTALFGQKYLSKPGESPLLIEYSQCEEITFGTKFDTSTIKNMNNMFSACKSLRKVNLGAIDTKNVQNMSCMFESCESLTTVNISTFDTSRVTDMSGMFAGCKQLTSINLGEINTDKVLQMSRMFSGCSMLQKINVISLKTARVKSMDYMFYNCSSLTELDLSSFATGEVENMAFFFAGCSKLQMIRKNGWNTKNVTSMESMFYGCCALKSIDLSDFNTSSVTCMSSMFQGCSLLTEIDISSFTTEKLTEATSMFTGCCGMNELDVSKCDFKNVINSDDLLNGCNGLSSIKAPFHVRSNIQIPSAVNTEWLIKGTSEAVLFLPKETEESPTLVSKPLPMSVSFKNREVLLEVDEKFMPEPIILPQNASQEVTWKESVINKIAIENDAITALIPGHTSVTCTTHNKEVFTSFDLYVREKQPKVNIEGDYLYNFEALEDYLINGEFYKANAQGRIKAQVKWIGKTVSIIKTNPEVKANSLPQKLLVDIDVSMLPLKVSALEEYTYTGAKICPEVTVTAGDFILRKGIDYSVSYTNNISAAKNNAKKHPTITVKGKGKFKGKTTVAFTINQLNLSEDDADFKVDVLNTRTTGKRITLKPIIRVKGKAVSSGEYSLSYPDTSPDAYIEPGKYSIVITGNNKNVIGTYTAMQGISGKLINKVTVELQNDRVEYASGLPCGVRMTVTDTSVSPEKVLEQGVDYSVSYKNNVEIGTATVTIKGMAPNYAGETKKKFYVVGRKLTAEMFSDCRKMKDYDGTPYQPFTDTNVPCDGTKELVLDEDYTITYSKKDLTKPGSGRITFTGIKRYTGKIIMNYKVLARNIDTVGKCELKQTEYTFVKEGVKPDVVLVDHERTLVQGVDYRLSYQNYKQCSTETKTVEAKVTITGKGGYTGKKVLTYTIYKSPIGSCVISANAKNRVLKNTSRNYITSFTLIDSNGKKLSSGTDYDQKVTYEMWNEVVKRYVPVDMKVKRVPMLGEDIHMRIVVKGKGNYTGVKYVYYTLIHQ